MINFSPKANLRNPATYSSITELSEGGFKEVIDDVFIENPTQVKKVLLCTGKLFFEMSDKQQKEN
ncbi:hypothetical protein VJI76_09355, partial [Parvimonas sp. M13]|nr:hypothetical protein [Parvimonas sp. M13]